MPSIFLTISDKIDMLNAKFGQSLIWLSLLLVLLQFSLVVLSHVFHVGFIGLQELLFYLNSLMFLGGAGYTLLHEGHVRVDVYYLDAPSRTKHYINFFGCLVLLLPVLILIWVSATPFVIKSWQVFEGSIETSGLHAVFILKTFILLYALSLTAQCFSLAVHSINGLKNETKL
jgi:TRAP-type mannitol/chloroaromatic compound transport system permease small subunit